jgi:hypothetical protein
MKIKTIRIIHVPEKVMKVYVHIPNNGILLRGGGIKPKPLHRQPESV